MKREHGLGLCIVLWAFLAQGCATSSRPAPATRVVPVAPKDAASIPIAPPVAPDIDIDGEPEDPDERPPEGGLFHSWAPDKAPSLDAAPLTPVSSLGALCTELRSKHGLPFGPGLTVSHVRSSCAQDGVRMLPPNWSFVAFRQTFTMPRHGGVTNVFARLVFRGRSTLASETLEATAVMSMADGDASGHIDLVRVDHLDLIGSAAPELVFTIRYESGRSQTTAARSPFSTAADPRKFVPFVIVVCDADGAWCTSPVGLGKVPPGHKDEIPPHYTFSKGPKGLLVECTTVPSKPSELVLRLP